MANEMNLHGNEALHFRLLPGFAAHLRHSRLREFCETSLELSRRENIPLLKYFQHLSDEELIVLSMQSTSDLFQQIIDNQVVEFTQRSLEMWKKNILPLISRDQIVADDITLGTFVRKQTFLKFLPEYAPELEEAIPLIEEIDRFTQYTETKSIRAFILIQQEALNNLNASLYNHEQQLLEAQRIGNIGSFEWDLAETGNRSVYSPQLYRIFEMEKSGTLPEFLNFVHEDDREKVKTALHRAMTGEAPYDCEYRYARNGKEKVIWSRGIVEFVDGKPKVLKGTVMDVTDRHHLISRLENAGQELEQKNLELEQSNKELASFSYIASHDLQEPLRKIKTYCNRILEKEAEQLSPFAKDYFQRIVNSAGRMQKLIEDVLSFSRTHTTDQSLETVDLNVTLKEVRESFREPVEEKKLVIDAAPLPSIRAVPFQVYQLFENIVGNSLKYGKPDEPVKVQIQSEEISGATLREHGASPEKKYHCIRISDNGIGFDPKHADRIFGIFQRLHGKGQYPGTGIGLAICKKIMQNHGGFITASGKVDEGATFELYFPV